jgi:hypothetical protein
MGNNKIKICLTLDDFSVENHRLDLLFTLKNKFPDFKVSLFTIPIDVKNKELSRVALNRIKENLDWIQIIPHGLYHNSSEAKKWTYGGFKNVVIPAIDCAFKKDGLSYVKGFKAPHWDWNKEVVQALDDLGWWGAISPKRPEMPQTKRFYTYDYSIDETLVLSPILRLQGHINPVCKDDLELNMENLMKLPKDAKWCFATDFIETK